MRAHSADLDQDTMRFTPITILLALPLSVTVSATNIVFFSEPPTQYPNAVYGKCYSNEGSPASVTFTNLPSSPSGIVVVGYEDMSDCTGSYQIDLVEKGTVAWLQGEYASALWYYFSGDFQSVEADQTYLVTQDALAELKG